MTSPFAAISWYWGSDMLPFVQHVGRSGARYDASGTSAHQGAETEILDRAGEGVAGRGAVAVRKRDPTGEEKAALEARFRAALTGMIVYHSAGDAPVYRKNY
jgi:hypothetical protein